MVKQSVRVRWSALAARCLTVLVASALATGCDKTSPSEPDFPVAFTASIMNPGDIQYITPLGMMNTGSHVIPTSHSYWYRNGGNTIVPIFAPAAGKVARIDHGADDSITVRLTDDVEYYLFHVIVQGGISEGTTLTAGQQIGTSSSQAGAVDFGVQNRGVSRNFVVTARYIDRMRHADHPLAYYQEPLRSQLLEKNPGKGDKLGRNTWDQDNTLAGNWFIEGTPATDAAMGPAWWHGYLAFVYDPITPSQIIVSYGTGLDLQLNGFPQGGPLGAISGPNPETVTQASGKVIYRVTGFLSNPGLLSPQPLGTIIAEMTGPRTVRVQGFPDQRPDPQFDAGAKVYVR